MTVVSQTVATVLAATRRGIGHLFLALIDTCRLGFTAWRAVPGFVAIAAIPEFAQHVVEIRLGMFKSGAAAYALINHPLRWQFGYAKLAGLVIAMVLIARYWAMGRSWRRAVLAPPRIIGRALLAVVVLLATAYVLTPARIALPMPLDIARSIASLLLQTGLLAWIVCILFEDDTITLRRAFTERYPSAIVITLLFFAAMLPGQFLHGLAHRIAIGRRMTVWLLMGFDAAVVGTMAALAGSALYVGYRSGLTWRGWRPLPDKTKPA